MLLEVLGTLRKCYVSSLFGLTTFPLTARVLAENDPLHSDHRARARGAGIGHRFWEPWANAMLAILLPKLWFGLKIMTGTTVFACLPGAHPYWTQKSFKTNSFT